MSGYQYIATPYSVLKTEELASQLLEQAGGNEYDAGYLFHKYKVEVLCDRVIKASIACRKMLLKGGFPFSPIVHGHFIERMGGGEVPYDTWMKHSFAMLRKADAFYILTLDGWKESKGVQAEKEFAMAYGIPVGYLNAQEWCKEE